MWHVEREVEREVGWESLTDLADLRVGDVPHATGNGERAPWTRGTSVRVATSQQR